VRASKQGSSQSFFSFYRYIPSVISLVVPFRDEFDNIESLVEAVHQALDADTFETTCVNDGSRDGSGAS